MIKKFLFLFLGTQVFIISVRSMDNQTNQSISYISFSDVYEEIPEWQSCSLLTSDYALQSNILEEKLQIKKRNQQEPILTILDKKDRHTAISPNQNLFALIDQNNGLTIYDIEQKDKILELQNPTISLCKFISDRYIIYAQKIDETYSSLNLFDVLQKKIISTSNPIESIKKLVALKKQIAAYCHSDFDTNPKWEIWDYENNKQFIISIYLKYISNITSNNNQYLVGSHHNNIYCWNKDSINHEVIPHEKNIASLGFINEHLLLSGTDYQEGKLRLWDIVTKTCLKIWEFSQYKDNSSLPIWYCSSEGYYLSPKSHYNTYFSPITNITCSHKEILLKNGLGVVYSIKPKKPEEKELT